MILSALANALARLMGGVAESTVGWDVVLLFGRVPQARQRLLAWIALGSLLWLGAILAFAVPAIGAWVVGAIPRPGFVTASWVAAVLLAAVTLLPLTIGLSMVVLTDPAERPKGLRLVGQILRGYLYAAVMGVTIVFLAVVSVVRSVRSLERGWQSDHLPVIVKAGRYAQVVASVEDALHDAGLESRRQFANRAYDVPPHLLAAVAGSGVSALIPDRLVEIRSGELGILVYPSDVAMLGPAEVLVRARASIARRLAFGDAYLTKGEEAQAVEDRLAELRRTSPGLPADFAWVDEALSTLVIPYDDWETLERLRLQAERNARAGAGRDARPITPSAPSRRLRIATSAAAEPIAAFAAAEPIVSPAAKSRQGLQQGGGRGQATSTGEPKQQGNAQAPG